MDEGRIEQVNECACDVSRVTVDNQRGKRRGREKSEKQRGGEEVEKTRRGER